MAASGALAVVLQHDAVGAAEDAQLAAPGADLTVKGAAQPFVPRAGSAREASGWAAVARHLDNFTSVVDTGEPGTVVLVTTPQPGPPAGTVVVATGPVVLRVPHPDGSGRTVVVLRAARLDSPILFR